MHTPCQQKKRVGLGQPRLFLSAPAGGQPRPESDPPTRVRVCNHTGHLFFLGKRSSPVCSFAFGLVYVYDGIGYNFSSPLKNSNLMVCEHAHAYVVLCGCRCTRA